MMKIHVLRDLTAYYIHKGRKWVVEEGSKKRIFECFESMIEAHPELLELPVMQVAKERRNREKFRPTKIKSPAPIPHRPINKRSEKIVSCYYCSGSGELFQGVMCPNCHGEKEILVTTHGLG